MAKTNGKAKLREHDVLLLPAPWPKLTPKRARRWLAKDHPAWISLVELLLQDDLTPEARHDVQYLAYSISTMVAACADAIESESPVRLRSEYFGEEGSTLLRIGCAATPLRLIELAAAVDLTSQEGELLFADAQPVLRLLANGVRLEIERAGADLRAERDARRVSEREAA